MSGTTEDIQITTSGGETMNAYLALPEGGGPAPSVIVWMEIFGVNDHIRDVTRRVAAEGYVAVAPDFFHRTGPGLNLGYDDAGFEEGFKLCVLRAEAIKASLAKNGTNHEVHVYDADHGFHCDQRGTYHEASAKDAWEKTKALFSSKLR